MKKQASYQRGFLPYALAAFLIGIVGGFSTVLGPAFVQELGIGYHNTTWTALAQAMSSAACAPILGKAGDIIGRRATLLLGIAVFTLGNILSALAGSLFFMLAARFVVGIGIAAMSPVIIAYIVSEFPQERTAAGFSLYMLISSASVIAGPTLGSLIIDACGWRTMLWICAAICAAVLAACLVSGPEASGKKQVSETFDWSGAVLVVLFFSLILCIPSFGQNLGWDAPAFRAVLLAAAISLAALLAVEQKKENSVLPFGFMRQRAFVLSVLALFLTQGLMQANMTNLIIFVRYTQPEETALSGYAISVMYLGMSLGAALLGPLADRYPPKHILIGALILTGAGCGFLLCFTASAALPVMMLALGLLGFGLGGNGTIFMKVVLSGLAPEDAGTGTGTYGLFRDLAAPFGAAVFVPLFTNRIAAHISRGIAPPDAAVQAIHLLSAAELICIVGALAAVLCLPNSRQQGDSQHEITK